MRIVVAVDKFKGSLSAAQAADHIGVGLQSVDPAVQIVTAPVADGGDGTVDAMIAVGFDPREVTVAGPTGAPVRATFAVRENTCVVELANSCGLQLLPGGTPAPMTASSHGLGQAMAAALDSGCDRLVVGVGGSAGTDGGAGMLTALGARILDGHDRPVTPGGAGLRDVRRVDLTGAQARLAGVRLELACDVDNPLTGEHGAAQVYGPQKGATAEQVHLLDDALAHFASVAGRELADRPGAGAAGGVGYAALLLGARLTSGIETVLELTGFAGLLSAADLVITGEGSLDAQSLRGKAPVGVARAARAHGVPVRALAGRVLSTPGELRAAGLDAAYALTDLETDLDTCMKDAGTLLERRAATLLADVLERTR
ncbi:glycerate kinase [Allobranchiibius sp. CTAmp26]|uniref:glycerate kinase n=1 Tax=Allobranchiibius sp. CTAmp26 TaxID=2815214 RepID=UPI001AA17E05|nr:glycerate kinase [Allobranchiibius sp. CTAmp26]MBO1756618.1 glycerate kinase [Allobranchiibius sp. CTAmp26]